MDPLSVLSAAFGAIRIVEAAVLLSNPARKAYYDKLRATKRGESSLLGQNYGSQVATFVTLLLPKTATQYEQIDAEVLHGGDEETLAFRQAITDESNMTAIAVRPQPIFIYPTFLLIADGRALSLRRWQSQH